MKDSKQDRLQLHDLERAIQENPCDSDAHFEVGQACYLAGRWKEAVVCFRKALGLGYEEGESRIYLAIALARQGESSAAEDEFRTLLEVPTGGGCIRELRRAFFGDFLAREGRKDEAEQYFLEALSIDPECTPALRDYAHLCYTLDRDAEAENLLLTALRIDPDDKYTLFYYGRFLTFFGDRHKEADWFLEQAEHMGTPAPRHCAGNCVKLVENVQKRTRSSSPHRNVSWTHGLGRFRRHALSRVRATVRSAVSRVPPPRWHLIWFHALLAAPAKPQSQVIPSPPWLLRRVFAAELGT